MLKKSLWTGLFHQHFAIGLANMIVLSFIVLPLAGCSDNGQSGPIISSLSTPTDTPSAEVAQSDSDSPTVPSSEEEDPTISTASDPTPVDAEDADLLASAPSPDGEEDLTVEDPAVSITSTPTGATARLTWDASTDPNVLGYFVHYGKRSSSEPGSCSYDESQRVGAPPATVTGLDPNTVYFFAISAFGESESESDSPCSNEVIVVTPSVQS